MNNVDKQYLSLLEDITANGVTVHDRTGVGTKSVFGKMLKFNLQDGLPVLTTKKIHLKSIIFELLWFLKGETNVKFLQENGVTIWDEWAKEGGDLGPVYGKQWVNWDKLTHLPHDADPQNYIKSGINQIQQMVDRLKVNPDCRRMVVSAWNVADLSDMSLTPCHYAFQFKSYPMDEVERHSLWINNALRKGDATSGIEGEINYEKFPKRKLCLLWNQRSVDTFLGLPFNIASYAILLEMFAQVTNHVPWELTAMLGDTHIYLNHHEQVAQQLKNEPYDLPRFKLNPDVKDIFDFKYEDFELLNYESHPAIKAPIAV
jgi:thymidylate synthase